MGCCSSAIETEIVQFPEVELPAYGPPVEHVFTDLVLKWRYGKNRNRKWYNTDIRVAFPDLAEQHGLGYRLLEFLPLPYQVSYSHCGSNRKHVYQGIFIKDPTDESTDDWMLHVERASHKIRSTTSSEGLLSKMTTTHDMSETFTKINEITSNGARYLGLTQTGIKTTKRGFRNSSLEGVESVALLFEIPVGPPKEIYVYRTLSQPISTKASSGSKCDFDYWSTVDSHLAEGWRLITAFIDLCNYGIVNPRIAASKTQIECLYVFEKPSSRMGDNSRQYEGVAIELPYKLKSNCGGVVPVTKWNATIEYMGRQGWHITTILPTPKVDVGCRAMTTNVILFFQRKVSDTG